MKNNKILKIFSIIYYVLAIICVFALILILAFASDLMSAIESAINVNDLKGVKPETVLSIVVGCKAALYALMGWLSSRVAHKKSNGIVLMVLLIISIVSGVIGLIENVDSLGIILLAIDAFALYFVFKAKKK